MGTALKENKVVHLSTRKTLSGSKSQQLPEHRNIHHTAVIDPSARISGNCTIMAGVVIDGNAVVEDGVVIYPNVYVGRDSRIGADTILHPNVTLRENTVTGKCCRIHSGSVIGSDGFGFVQGPDGRNIKVPQVGSVVLGDDVVIGSNVAIDRGTLGRTIIGNGVVIEAQTQIGHNVVVGDNSRLGAMAGICGSAKIGSNVEMGHDVAMVGHISIGDGVKVADGSSITKNIEPGHKVAGFPAVDTEQAASIQRLQENLPDLYERLKALEKESE
jgi:UDP-3-O-[3-hydroxymyristoyl] glucosamine N-acyltransferase